MPSTINEAAVLKQVHARCLQAGTACPDAPAPFADAPIARVSARERESLQRVHDVACQGLAALAAAPVRRQEPPERARQWGSPADARTAAPGQSRAGERTWQVSSPAGMDEARRRHFLAATPLGERVLREERQARDAQPRPPASAGVAGREQMLQSTELGRRVLAHERRQRSKR